MGVFLSFGARDRNWTGMVSLPQDFKSCASTCSATWAEMVTLWRFELQTPWLKVKCSTDWAREWDGWGGWDRTSEMTESKSVALPLGYTPTKLVGGGRFELPNPKEQIYSLPRLASSLSLQYIHGAENRTWTRNLLITNQLLYQLSYFGIKNGGGYRTRTYDPLLVRQVL